jgi:hypothetical protein
MKNSIIPKKKIMDMLTLHGGLNSTKMHPKEKMEKFYGTQLRQQKKSILMRVLKIAHLQLMLKIYGKDSPMNSQNSLKTVMKKLKIVKEPRKLLLMSLLESLSHLLLILTQLPLRQCLNNSKKPLLNKLTKKFKIILKNNSKRKLKNLEKPMKHRDSKVFNNK